MRSVCSVSLPNGLEYLSCDFLHSYGKDAFTATRLEASLSHFIVMHFFLNDCGLSMIGCSVIVTVVIELFVACRTSTDWYSSGTISVCPCKTFCSNGPLWQRISARKFKDSFGLDQFCGPRRRS